MSTLPSASEFNSSSVRQDQFKSKLAQMLSFLSGLLGTDGSAASARAALGLGGVVTNYNNTGVWVTAHAYALNDLVTQGGLVYCCVIAHTSGTFATNLAAGNWVIFQGLTTADLSVSTGSGLVGHVGRTSSIPTTVQNQIRNLEHFPSGASRLAAVIWDDFDCADITLAGRICPTGQVWTVSGPGATICKIVSGAVIADGYNFYASLPSAERLGSVSAVVSFASQTGATTDGGGTVTLMLQNASQDLGTMLHMQVTAHGWSCQKRLAGGAFNTLASGLYNLALDGTKHAVSMEVVGTTVTWYTPDGKSLSMTDTDIASMDLLAATFQITGSASTDGWIARIHAVGAGQPHRNYSPLFSGAASKGEVARIEGAGWWKRNSVTHTFAADGWYRIAYNMGYGGYTLIGRIAISTFNIVFNQVECEVWGTGGAAPSIKQLYSTGGYCIDQVRIGTDAAAAYLDVHIQNTASGAVTAFIDVTGFMVLYPKPLAAPTTPALVASITPTASIAQTQIGIANTSDWYNIATTGSNFAGSNCGIGRLTVKAVDTANRMITFDVLISLSGGAINAFEIINNVSLITPIYAVRIWRRTSPSFGDIFVDVLCNTGGANAVTLEVTRFGWIGFPITFAVANNSTSLETITKVIFEQHQDIALRKTYPDADDSYVFTTATTGSTYQAGKNDSGVYHYGANLASWTVKLPSNPSVGQEFTINTNASVSTLTVQDSSGGALLSGSLNSFTEYAWRIYSGTGLWIRTK